MFLSEEPSKSSISNKSFDIKNLFNRSSDEIQSSKLVDDPLMGKLGSFLNQQKQSKLRKSQQQNNFKQIFPSNHQIRRISQSNKSQPQIRDSEHVQEMQLIENYLGYHNKFKTYFKGKKFKKIYNELIKQMPSEKSYYAMYMIDKLFSLNKHIKISLVHKETSFVEYLSPYFQAGKKLISQFYKYFLVDDQLHKATKKVNIQAANGGSSSKSSNSNQFFYIVVTFLLQLAIFYRSKNMRKQAQTYYECNLRLIYKMLSSSTSNSKLRRKICQYLISFGSFLIESREYIKAKKILEIALNNCINLVGIIESKIRFSQQARNKSNISQNVLSKYKKRTQVKLKQAFNFMIAIYLNIAVLYELQGKEYLSFLALNQVRFIEQIIYKNYFIKSRVPEVIKKPKQAFESYNEKLHVVKTYFDMQKILSNIKEQQQMKFNPHVGIYGLKEVEKNCQNNKSIMQLFFFNETRKKKDLQKQRSSVFTNKIALIQYDSQIDFQERQRDRDNQLDLFQYTITTKNPNGSQSTSIYNHVRSPNQKRALTTKISEGQRRSGRKLSKFCNQQVAQQNQQKIRETKKSSTIFETQNIKETKKAQRNFTYNNGMKSSKISVDSLQKSGSGKQGQKQNDFLDELIENEVQSKNFFLYGKQFVQKYDNLSKGKKLQQNVDIKSPYQSVDINDRKRIQYNGKKEILELKQKQKPLNLSKSGLFNQRQQPKNHSRSLNRQRNSSKNIVKNAKDTYLDPNHNNFKKSDKKSKSLKSEPMNYKEVVKSIQKTQAKIMRTDLIDKNSIYRLKCRSQMTAKSNQAIRSVSNDVLGKNSSNNALLNSMKKQDQRQAFMSKLQKRDKLFRSLNAEGKSTNLSKKALNSNLFSHNETGIRLLKKIIYKHKKTLKINKPDLFVNYNKMQSEQQQIKLVERQSYLMVQYQMCESQTKERIKQNMQQLIVDNIRKSQEHDKRVLKINKALDEHGKTTKIDNFSTRIRQEFHSSEKTNGKSKMIANTNYSSNKNESNINMSSADKILLQIFEQRILMNSNQKDDLGLQEDKFLTGNKIKNPNLFLSSIKFKQQKKGNKKIKTTKNINNLWLKPDSEQDQSSYHDAYTKNAHEIYSGNTSHSIGGTNGQIQENSNLLSDNWI